MKAYENVKLPKKAKQNIKKTLWTEIIFLVMEMCCHLSD